MKQHYDVIIIGGGITGAGTARDCALRGLKTLLIERGNIADGASGRNHGLLHSGARYAVNDRESARECIEENLILRKVAANCIEECEGLFISLPEDGLDFQANFLESCAQAGIQAQRLSPEKALKLEPNINPSLIGAVRVPDASVDPFRLVSANILDARLHGADIMCGCELVSLIKENVTVIGVKVLDHSTGTISSIYAHYVINAAGIWGASIAQKAGAHISMLPAKGALIVFNHRLTKMVINRCRKPSNADILVPGDVVSVIGTTSDKIPFEDSDNVRATKDEVDLLLQGAAQLVPESTKTRAIRAYAGVRPLVSLEDDASGRNVSRGMVLLDHGMRDGIRGFITITGGKLTTYRLMAEKTTDLICQKLSLDKSCETAHLPLPGSEPIKKKHFLCPQNELSAYGRHGSRVELMDFEGKGNELICECEKVRRAEITYAVKELGVNNLDDLRKRTRLGMGPCQGTFCIENAARVLAEEMIKSGANINGETPVIGSELELAKVSELALKLKNDYLQRRWKGIIPVCWEDQLAQAEYLRNKYGK